MSKLYEVGKVYPELLLGGEGIKFDFMEDGPALIINFNGLTPSEVMDFKKGKFKYKALYLNGVIWMLFKFASQNWMDAPYIVHLSKDKDHIQEIDNYRDGYGLMIMVSDSATGKLKVMRLVGLDNKFSRDLYGLIERQKEETSREDLPRLSAEIREVYSTLTTDQLVLRARI